MHNSKRKGQKSKKRQKESALQISNVNAAGIDIGSEEHYVAVPADRDEEPVRSFGCFTSELQKLADWLEFCGIETVAMESTGVYWIPLYQLLEQRGFKVLLVNARHVKNVAGRKTDVLDCQWLQQLHSYGLLEGSFRPEEQICVLRSYVRHRDSLIKSTVQVINRMQKALTQMNIQLHKVISDITGVTGRRIIEAILSGERDSKKLARMKDGRIKSSCETIAEALHGDWREEHIFVLRQEYELYGILQEKIKECDRQVEQLLLDFDSKVDPEETPPPKPKRGNRKPKGNEPGFDLRTQLYRITGVDFTTVDGFSTSTLQELVAECGLDANKWPTEKHFSSWLGLAPNNKITGGKIKGRTTRKVVNRAATALRLAAQALTNSRSALGAYFRRMKMRHGPAKAITATAHKLACIFYRMLKFGNNYVDPGVEYYEKKYRERVLNSLKRRAKQLGYQLVENQMVGCSVS